MTDIIQEMRGLIAKATPGPYLIRTLENFGFNVVHYQDGDKFNIVRVGKCADEANAALIVAAINHLPALLDRLEAAEADNAKIRKMLVPQWFYADGYSSEDCCDSPAEALCEFDLEPGKHIRQVDCAGPMPSIWCVVHVLTDEEKDALDTDDDEIITEFASKEEAEAAIREVKP